MTDKTNLPQKPQAEGLAVVIEKNYKVVDLDAEEDFSIMRALYADNPTERFASPESQPLDEMTGEPFWLDGIDFFARTQMKDSDTPYYVYLRCHWDDGRGFSATTGSAFSMSRAIGADKGGELPRRVMSVLVPSKSKPGHESLWLVEAPERHHKENGLVVETTAEAQIS